MSIISWIIIGAVAGWIASMIMGRNARMGWLANIIVGIVGALIGGFVWGLITGSNFVATFSLGTLLVAIVGAVILLAIYGAVSRA
ncbi:GlsB/YeaQ/YmgE family stress response membrane protein [Nitrolancea hollandica]|uniref:Transglycosylase-associated protein n=1 Tax=Nitrolancea hollandica Lb TaxID=1129897 RepID=I4EIX9_9BACT|nr:GlsB/YeaQ/YmgE family stress response membrane protein [Nitrolancea hollandica]CCF84641.1 Transglycosylase-associated protein [Nitrolancea hollandica Lb]